VGRSLGLARLQFFAEKLQNRETKSLGINEPSNEPAGRAERPADANRVNLALLYLAEGRDSSAQRADADAKHKYFAVRSRAACEGLVELLEACSDSRVVGFRGNDAALFLCDPAVGFRSSPVCHPYSTAKLCY
jgi:hypothetical protein